MTIMARNSNTSLRLLVLQLSLLVVGSVFLLFGRGSVPIVTPIPVVVEAFVLPSSSPKTAGRSSTRTTTTIAERQPSTTALSAVSALVRKAKEAELRQQIQDEGIPEAVMAHYKRIQQHAAQKKTDDPVTEEEAPLLAMGPLQTNLTRRKGTITVIAEYKRKIADGANGYLRVDGTGSSSSSSSSTSSSPATATADGNVVEVVPVATNAPELLSAEFREFGAGGIAILADARMGGCTYHDLQLFVDEQRRAINDVPGPVPIINSDIIIDELQVAQSAAIGVAAITLDYALLATTTSSGTSADGGEVTLEAEDNNESVLGTLAQAAHAVHLEIIIAVRSKEEVQHAIAIMDRYVGREVPFMLSVVNTDGVDAKVAVMDALLHDTTSATSPHRITLIANILHQSDQGLAEVEETWALRDQGFHVAWISDALYKAGNDASEHPGAIIKSMAAKSSVRWASPVAKSGRGEGAREYLGDIMM